MFDPKIFDDIAKKLSAALPKGVRDLEKDLEKKFRSILQSTFSKLDLVTRKEFDAQTKVLKRTREKVDAMEKKIKAMETKKPKKTKK